MYANSIDVVFYYLCFQLHTLVLSQQSQKVVKQIFSVLGETSSKILTGVLKARDIY